MSVPPGSDFRAMEVICLDLLSRRTCNKVASILQNLLKLVQILCTKHLGLLENRRGYLFHH
jgi:hypothetical protein